MTYHAAVDFYDLQDANRFYHAGETYPREGLNVTAARLDELAGDNNRMGHPLIVAEKPARKGRKADAQ